MFSFALQERNSQEQFEGMSVIVFQHGIDGITGFSIYPTVKVLPHQIINFVVPSVIDLLSFVIEERF